ncbi:hypothetical protein GCM10023185_21230 [Hymenobacter saemangeumensis]|uniref:Glycosyltransferase RgtA/B/C/D-like domain-containing protein n=1 Tax=Hymenobacter saemangeumensis TaxID=1084522 RepID=A0ABP8IE00_9BACT
MLAFVAALGLAFSGMALGLLYGSSTYAQLQALGNLVYHENGYRQLPLALTAERLQWLRSLLALAGAGGVATAVWLHRRHRPVARLKAEASLLFTRSLAWWKRLPLQAKALCLALTALLLLVRAWYMLNYPLSTDEIASYDFFVRPGLLSVTSFYPIPNNHIFYNLLAWPLAQLGLSPRLVMRLPTLVLGSAGTAVGLVLLARLTGLRLALLITGLVGLSPLWAYYAAVGRGYFLQFCLVQAGFFAVLELLRRPAGFPHLAWLAFLASSVLGLYCVPSYAYPLAALGLGLGSGLLLQRRAGQLPALAAAGAFILLLTLVLYLPVGMVSGWEQLLGNRYVASKAAADFWPPFRAVLYETAAELFGPSLRISGPWWLAAACLGAAAVRCLLPAGPRRNTAFLAWLLLALPLPMMMAQRVYAPTRVLLYLTYFGYLLLALLILQPRLLCQLRRLYLPLLTAVLLTGGYRLYQHQAQVQASQRETRQLTQAFWFIQQHAGKPQPTKVWLNAPLHELFFAHYSRQLPPASQLLLHSSRNPVPGPGYDWLVVNNRLRANFAQQKAYRALYRDQLVTIYARVR